MGFPIRTSADQSFLAAPHGFSQHGTSFIACICQGIPWILLSRLIDRQQAHARRTIRRAGWSITTSPSNGCSHMSVRHLTLTSPARSTSDKTGKPNRTKRPHFTCKNQQRVSRAGNLFSNIRCRLSLMYSWWSLSGSNR